MTVRMTKYGIECDQNWEDLQTRDCGKFCETCNKPVMDFLSWDRDTVVRYMKTHPKTCGRFRMDQLKPGIKSGSPYFNPRSLLFGALSIWGLSAGNAMPLKEKTGTVQIVQEPKLTPLFTTRNRTIAPEVKRGPDPITDSLRLKQAKTAWRQRRHYISRRTYISWQFPFFHKRRRLMGCFNF